MVAAGVLGGVWVLVVWQWKDPFTSLYTMYEQHQLSGQYKKRAEQWQSGAVKLASLASVRQNLAAEAARYRRTSKQGEAIGRLKIPRLGLNMILVNGTDEGSLQKGPGRDLRTYMPGQGQLVYIAGHRTTFLAPFSHIDQIRPGDSITIEVPYGTFRYSATGHRIVPAGDVAELRSHGRETVTLQACHPRFFATHRYLVYARPVSVQLMNGRTFGYNSAGRVSLGSGRASLQVPRRRASALSSS
jgi:sortase A